MVIIFLYILILFEEGNAVNHIFPFDSVIILEVFQETYLE